MSLGTAFRAQTNDSESHDTITGGSPDAECAKCPGLIMRRLQDIVVVRTSL